MYIDNPTSSTDFTAQRRSTAKKPVTTQLEAPSYFLLNLEDNRMSSATFENKSEKEKTVKTKKKCQGCKKNYFFILNT